MFLSQQLLQYKDQVVSNRCYDRYGTQARCAGRRLKLQRGGHNVWAECRSCKEVVRRLKLQRGEHNVWAEG
jgi:hypothetical protein